MSARILVLNCFVKGWNILKRLADDGFEVNAAHYTDDAPGLHSNRIKDTNGNLIYPNPKTDEAGFVEAVLDHISRIKFDIVLPVNAAEMMALARVRREIEKHAAFPFENYYKLMLLHDKKYFFELMAGSMDERLLPKSWSVGNQTPPIGDIIALATMDDVPTQPMDDFPTIDHFINANPGIIYPLVVKTRRSTSSVGVYRVNDEKQLRDACERLDNSDLIIQENLVGRGVGISTLRWTHPDVSCWFGHKRVREYPISGGASTSREPWDCDNLPLTAHLMVFLDKLDWHGVVMFELKEMYDGTEHGRYCFLEANPRFWGSVPLAMANGVNFPVVLCRAVLGMDIPPIVNAKRVRARILFSDTLSLLLNVFKGRRIWYHLGDFFNFKNVYLDDIDFGDFPGTRKIFRRMLAEFVGRILKKSS